MKELRLRELKREELEVAAEVVGRAMADNPMAVAIFGNDRRRRARGNQRFFDTVLKSRVKPPLVACSGDRIVGVLASEPPGTCKPPLKKQLKMVPRLIGVGRPGDMYRGLVYVRERERHDLGEKHWHLGPVAVDPSSQGGGIGSKLLESFCAEMDSGQEVSFLETEKPENVRLYERFGFEVIDESKPLGVKQWFMRRAPGCSTG